MLTNKNVIRRIKFNISLIGEMLVGKSAIFNYLKYNDFREDYLYYSLEIGIYIDEAIFDKKIIKFKIFDTLGQERYKKISNNYINISDGIMIIFSVIDRCSFEKIDEWMNLMIELIYQLNQFF